MNQHRNADEQGRGQRGGGGRPLAHGDQGNGDQNPQVRLERQQAEQDAGHDRPPRQQREAAQGQGRGQEPVLAQEDIHET
jgi:hypothetical protein